MPLGKRTDYGDARFAGVRVPFTSDVPQTVEAHGLCGFDFVVTPLVRPDYRPLAPSASSDGQQPQSLSRDDVLYLNTSRWANQVVGEASSWIDPDALDPELRRQSVVSLKQELAWAAHLGLQAVVLPPVRQPLNAPNFAQILNQALQGLTHMALWLVVPLTPHGTPTKAASTANGAATTADTQTTTTQSQAPASSDGAHAAAPASAGGAAAGPCPDDAWESWHQVRALCDQHNLLGCVLRLGAELPCAASLARWLAEPVKAVMVDTCVFSTNKRGYPVLPKAHQELLAHMFTLGVQVIVSGEACHPVPQQAAASGSRQLSVEGITVVDPGESHPLRPYWEYCCFLFRKLPAVDEQGVLEASYRDYLQAPLQPLQDNLESQTYETFERDVTKYDLYEEAAYKALLDRPAPAPAGPGQAAPATVLMVVGAGRGPLVRASMKAAARAGRQLRVYAVEKNPSAVIHIQNMLREEGWEDKVTIVSADMRCWQAPEQADILVSELLGSFGDNELSPECLDGAQRFLAPNGISIPQSYTSFLAPVTCSKLHNDVKNYKDLEHLETPYVVKLFKHYLLAPTQAFFTFRHPNHDDPIDNSRYKATTFVRDPAAGAAVMHGFAGYFECVLYKDVLLSIHPPTHSTNMFSWFPIFFPLREPVYVPAGAPVALQMWRCGAAHKVWYEWSVTAPVAGPIHNQGGRSYWVGL